MKFKPLHLISILSLLFFTNTNAQVGFSQADFSIKKSTNTKGTEINCTISSLSLKFQLPQQSVELKENFMILDSQVIQISPLKVEGYKTNMNNLDTAEQKQLLSAYSKYELDYFTEELKLKIINPSNQWVASNNRYWFIWYFRIENVPAQSNKELSKKVEIQLFASTLIGDHIFTINAPIMSGGDFAKAALTVNQMMETLTIAK